MMKILIKRLAFKHRSIPKEEKLFPLKGPKYVIFPEASTKPISSLQKSANTYCPTKLENSEPRYTKPPVTEHLEIPVELCVYSANGKTRSLVGGQLPELL